MMEVHWKPAWCSEQWLRAGVVIFEYNMEPYGELLIENCIRYKRRPSALPLLVGRALA